MVLEADGFDVIMLNAKAIRNIGEKKTDGVDAGWIMLLHSYGLLKSGFQPDSRARRIRNISRHRDSLLRASSKEVLHMQKAMELMNLKSVNVLSDIPGKSGQEIIGAIIRGERNAKVPVSLADPRCKASRQTVEKSLEASRDDDLLFMPEQSYNLYLYCQQLMQECDCKIESIAQVYPAQINPGEPEKQFIRAHKNKAQKNAVAVDIEKYAFEMWGVNLTGIDGISEGALLKPVGEPGHDFTRKFNSFKEFCCRCNIIPNNKISGGKLLSSKIPRRKNPVGLILRQAANSLNASKKPLGFYFRRVKSKNGHNAAVVATANKPGRITYVIVKNKTEYDPTKAKCTESDILKRKLIAAQKTLNNINCLINDVA